MRRGGQSSMSSQRTEDLLEGENDKELGSLFSKVSQLKEVTIGIGDEVRRQNSFLDDMSGSFEDTASLLGISMRKVKALTNSSSGRIMCYIVGFAVAVFFVIYVLIK
ncbi:hypothetical protein PTSG_00285 [Salpingoeca rosetta]|uniref:t-SNARE coiled-coil homology domain-containing protein n=1 Tax=Salpingoeca rosetta (strain ATCC 50818 / BSB-021) TaxID=946362 RepID=F2TW19_SALR5|nr:uncharacterized protein PTSG_00285 [Salpingoeca rosetta]EGD72265.1 hypothetical protein PTSG_00285 [Salpingoeca rosetta]|eukprot:XP_004998836.1 hypothetical protein PTSG_00285 [Salpingoeca rosetta]